MHGRFGSPPRAVRRFFVTNMAVRGRRCQVTGVETTTASRRATVQVRQAVDAVAGVAGEVSARLPEAATTTREAFEEANRMVRAGSDQTLKIVAATSIGFASGLFLGGAPRVLVLAALLPAGLVGAALMERMDVSERPTKVR